MKMCGFALSMLITVPSLASAGNCSEAIALEIRLEQPTILAYGVVVGQLVIRNASVDSCSFGQILSLRNPNLSYELRQPGGAVKALPRFKPLVCSESVQWAALAPGDSVAHPICLLKSEGGYLFAEEGDYEVRAILRGPLAPRLDSPGATQPVPARSKTHSNWAPIKVLPVGRGRPNYVNSHRCRDILEAFKCSEGLAEIMGDLSSFGDYQREQEKLLVFQLLGRRAVRGVLLGRGRSKELFAEARQALELARSTGVGVEMWEWIVNRLENYPEHNEGRSRFNVSNGVYF